MFASFWCVYCMAIVPQVVKDEEAHRMRTFYQRLKMTKPTTQAQISAACGWQSASTFSRFLSGQVALTLEPLTRIAQALGVHPALISTRLVQEVPEGVENRTALPLPVRLVNSVSRGNWGEPFLTDKRLNFFTADRSAFALIFAPGESPKQLEGWVLVVEPGRQGGVGDFVVVRHGPRKYSCGRIHETSADGGAGVDIEGVGVVLTTLKRTMLISCLCRPSDLKTIRALADY
jgi:transcriptional regulator with XRE-family HTH domain